MEAIDWQKPIWIRNSDRAIKLKKKTPSLTRDHIDSLSKFFVGKIKNRENFYIGRYGNGEFAAMFGKNGWKNANGDICSNELKRMLLHTFEERHTDNYFYTIHPSAIMVYKEDRIYNFMSNYGIDNHCSDWMFEASHIGKLYPLVKQLRETSVVYVGNNSHKDKIGDIIPIVDFIEIPPHNSYLKIDEIINGIQNSVDKHNPHIVGISAGMTAGIITHRLYDIYGDKLTAIDFGSLFDGFMGINTRSYHRFKYWLNLKNKNLYGKNNER